MLHVCMKKETKINRILHKNKLWKKGNPICFLCTYAYFSLFKKPKQNVFRERERPRSFSMFLFFVVEIYKFDMQTILFFFFVNIFYAFYVQTKLYTAIFLYTHFFKGNKNARKNLVLVICCFL